MNPWKLKTLFPSDSLLKLTYSKLISCLLIHYLATDYIKQYSREKEGQIDSFARKVISSSNSSRGQNLAVQKMWSYQIYGATQAIQLVENNVIYYQITQI